MVGLPGLLGRNATRDARKAVRRGRERARIQRPWTAASRASARLSKRWTATQLAPVSPLNSLSARAHKTFEEETSLYRGIFLPVFRVFLSSNRLRRRRSRYLMCSERKRCLPLSSRNSRRAQTIDELSFAIARRYYRCWREKTLAFDLRPNLPLSLSPFSLSTSCLLRAS